MINFITFLSIKFWYLFNNRCFNMGLNKKTFLSKCTTIVENNDATLGLNPVMELNYGKYISRCLIYFDHNNIKKLIDDKTYPNMGKLKHILKIKNTSSIQNPRLNDKFLTSDLDDERFRAASYDLIFFLIPKDFDDSRGFHYKKGMEIHRGDSRSYVPYGCNWYNYKHGCSWDNEGIYSISKLSQELDRFTTKNLKSDIIIGYQHFNYGNEPIELDITEITNKFILGEIKNYGIGIAFSPKYENMKLDLNQYCGFFTNRTNSFFEPYVETTYDETIEDDRNNFIINKNNRLYFYSIIGGKQTNLDEVPTCSINGVNYYVHQATKGVYYIELCGDTSKFEPDAMYYDVWSNIKYNGKTFKDVELSFVPKADKTFFNFGSNVSLSRDNTKLVPNIYGINYKEVIRRGDIRKVVIEPRVKFTKSNDGSVNNMYYRLYVLQGVDEIDVISWSKTERTNTNNYFLIDTNDLIPTRYYVDIKFEYDLEIIQHNRTLEFDISNDVTEVFV